MTNIEHNLALLDKTVTRVEPFRVYTLGQFDTIKPLKRLSEEQRFAMKVVAHVLPFRVNEYVIEQLIDWDNVPDDPIFQLTFPQPEMISPDHFEHIATLLRSNGSREQIRDAANAIHSELNPHPAGQGTLNVPYLNGIPLEGVQHKYHETILFFPSQGQTCHSYCTFCFRWPQFVRNKSMRFAVKEGSQLRNYLLQHKEVTDLLVTGGDPMVMKAKNLAAHLEPLLEPEFEHIQTIRFGTKSLSYWPHRFVTDTDASDLLHLFERIVSSGKQLAFMAHFNHWRELDTNIAHEAINRIRSTGAVIRTQGPLLAHINDDSNVWSTMWKMQVRLGMAPYYMFVERNTGARRYFEIPLYKAWLTYRNAIQNVSGLSRTARGPSMSAGPGKVEIQGVTEIRGEKVFVLRFIQGRNKDWIQQPFFAKFDPKATWLDQLKPAFGEQQFFFEKEYQSMQDQALAN